LQELVIKRHELTVAKGQEENHLSGHLSGGGINGQPATSRAIHRMPADKDMAVMNICWASWANHSRPVQKKQMVAGSPGLLIRSQACI